MEPTKTPKTYRVLELVPAPGQSSKPTELIQIRGHEALTLNARRAITLLWHNAHRQGIEEGKDYTIHIDELVTARHKGHEMVSDAIEALMTTLIVIPSADGSTRRVQVLGGNDLDNKNRSAGVLTYSFDKRLIEVLQNSTIWGKISLPELMAFSSKYAVTLYEHLCQWTGLSYKHSTRITLAQFRSMLGVEADKYEAFGALNKHVVKPAILEINALAQFNVAIMPVKTGKKVTHIHVNWWEKSQSELKEAFTELRRSKIGRKARIAGTVERVFLPSPSGNRNARRSLKDLLDD